MNNSNYYLPAEWEPHEATWLSWPNQHGATFPGDMLDNVLPTFFELIEALTGTGGETVAINISDEQERIIITKHLSQKAISSVRFHLIPTNEPWCRDHGPTVLKNCSNGKRQAICWNYNAWGGKYPPWDLDAAAAPEMAIKYGIETSLCKELTIEGGSLESDGNGLLMISESSVVCDRRNPGLSRKRLEDKLSNITGSREILWVNAEVAGDDTDGHVDCFARFAPNRTILAVTSESKNDSQLKQNADFLRQWADDRDWSWFGLPVPQPVVIDGMSLPATYANFYIANRAVIVPVFDDPADEVATDIISRCFPDRSVYPIQARQLIVGQGGIHCLTQPLPS